MFEPVYTVTDYYDGPREGIADLDGVPHYFKAAWDSGVFLLTPVDSETLALALEDWAIWTRWEQAFHLGTAGLDTHPALPEDRERHSQIKGVLTGRLVVDEKLAVRKRAEFRAEVDSDSLRVQWQDLDRGTNVGMQAR